MADTSTTVAPLGNDLLRGVAAISQFLGQPRRRVFYLLGQGRLPAGKEGALWVSSKTALRAHYERLTTGTAA
jgi:hypothetical protein